MATTIIPVVPTLHSGIGILTVLPEKAAYTLRHILSEAGKARQSTEKESVSIRQFIHEYEQYPDLLCSKLQIAIQGRMDYLYKDPNPGEQINIECIPQFYDDGAKYDIKIIMSGQYIVNERFVSFFETNIFEITEDRILKLKLEGTPYE